MAAAASRVYVVSMTRQAVTIAKTLAQVKPGATVPLQILRANLAQSSSTTSTQLPVQLNRKVTTAATVTSFPPILRGPSTDPAAAAAGGTTATGVNATAEGTDSDILAQDVWNYLNGWVSGFTPKDYPFVNAGTLGVGLKLPVAPAVSVDLTADVLFEELA